MTLSPSKDYAWAALRPDGRVDGGCVHNYQNEVREVVGARYRFSSNADPSLGWKAAFKHGWRVVRVELRPLSKARGKA